MVVWVLCGLYGCTHLGQCISHCVCVYTHSCTCIIFYENPHTQVFQLSSSPPTTTNIHYPSRISAPFFKNSAYYLCISCQKGGLLSLKRLHISFLSCELYQNGTMKSHTYKLPHTHIIHREGGLLNYGPMHTQAHMLEHTACMLGVVEQRPLIYLQ